jgi:hypothetical protein
MKYTTPVHTTFGAHRLVDQIAMAGQLAGLTVTHTHDGGWFSRRHVLIVEGQPFAVLTFASNMRSAINRLNGGVDEVL